MKQILFFCFLVLNIAACGHDRSPHVRHTPTASPTATATADIPVLPTETPTPTLTPSLTPTASPTPTMTPTLAVRVLEVTAVMPGVPGYGQISGTSDALPLDEWVRLESDHSDLEYVAGNWTPMWSWSAGQNEYRYSVDSDAAVRLTFEGEGVRICYVAFWNGGIWETSIDGQFAGRVDSYSPEAHFTCTDTFSTAPGTHTLVVHNTGEHNPASSNDMIALDAILIHSPHSASPGTPAALLTPTEKPQPAKRVELIQGPPVIRPTATDAPPAVVTVALIIAYDENMNRSVDPAEGVRGIPVRMVDVATNRVLAQAFTDESGYTRIQLQTNARISLVVPYFGQSWDISRRQSGNVAFTLLLPAGNQPGLIP